MRTASSPAAAPAPAPADAPSEFALLALNPWEPTPPEFERDALTPQQLSRHIETLLVGEQARVRLATFVGHLAGGTASSLAPTELDRVVSAFQASRLSRDEAHLGTFLKGMILGMGASRIHDTQLEHLLRAWRWRIDESFKTEGGVRVNVGTQLEHGVASAVATALGGTHMTASQRRLLVDAVCREPSDIDPVPGTDWTLDTHALWVARALRQVVVQTATDPLSAQAGEREASEEERLREVVDIVLKSRFVDPRWKFIIASNLTFLDQDKEAGVHLDKRRWGIVIWEEFMKQVEWRVIESSASPGGRALQLAPLDAWAGHILMQEGRKPHLEADVLRLAKQGSKGPPLPNEVPKRPAPVATTSTTGRARGIQLRPAS
jgi:hypothetical protein